LDLTTECEEAGIQFVAYLGNLTSSSSSKVVRVVKTAVKYQWSSQKINDFVDKLDRLRSSLILATVLAFRTSAEGNNQEILDHLREIQQDQQVRHLQDQIQNVQDAIKLLTDAVQNQSSDKLDAIQNGIQRCLGGVVALKHDVLPREGTRSRHGEILNWIDFRQITWRYDSVDCAYQRTYEWIFQPSGERLGRNDFTTYLEKVSEEPFFINGKAGSGKSTLMKFIHDDSRTKKALKRWAGPNELVILHFFFWNLGTNLQKSHAGLLRGLLHAALEQHPELIPAVFPKAYRNWGTWDDDYATASEDENKTRREHVDDHEAGHVDDDGTEHTEAPEPEYIEVKKAFELLISKSGYLRLAIFIDGIDEFDGDHREMATFLRSLASHHVKLIISSRPLNTCLHSLSGCPTLRLHDLTRRDMTAYVHGELLTHHLMTRLVEVFPTEAPHLASEIVDKAEGVFLWIKLVVRMLIKGLENGDSLEELHATLSALPSDLRDLYTRMFAKMDLIYRKESAVMFRLKEKWLNIAQSHALPGLVMWYAIHNPAASFDQPLGPIPTNRYDWAMSSLVNRVQSRCCGLLELRDKGKTLDGLSKIEVMGDDVTIDEVNHISIDYLHRTVHEFITVDDVWQGICDLTGDMLFDVSARLVSASLSIMKLVRNTDTRTDKAYAVFVTALCREVLDVSPETGHDYFMELDRIMTELNMRLHADQSHECTSDACSLAHWSQNEGSISSRIPANIVLLGEGTSHASKYTYAAGRGLLCYPMLIPADMSHRSRFEVVIHALSSWTEIKDSKDGCTTSLEQKVRTLTYVLDKVLGPEGECLDTSLWQIIVVLCEKLQNKGRYLEAAHLLKVALSAADAPWSLWRTAFKITIPAWVIWGSFSAPRRPVTKPGSASGVPHRCPADEREAILQSFRDRLTKPGTKDLAHLMNDIDRLVNSRKISIPPEHGHFDPDRTNQNSQSRNKKKKGHRSKKQRR
jgi:hypothetical protein